jgi:hypothetical protein
MQFYGLLQGVYLRSVAEQTEVYFDLTKELDISKPPRPIDEEAIKKLVKSLEHEGQLRPVMIRVFPNEKGEHSQTPELIYGFHVVEAAKQLELRNIRAYFVGCTDIEKQCLRIIENTARSDLSKADKGRLYLEYLKLTGRGADQPEQGGETEDTSNATVLDEAPVPDRSEDELSGDRTLSTTGRTTDQPGKGDGTPDTGNEMELDAASADRGEDKLSDDRTVSGSGEAPAAPHRGGRGNTGGQRQAARELGVAPSTFNDAIRAAQQEGEEDTPGDRSSTPKRPRAKLSKEARAVLNEGEVSDPETMKRIAKLPETEQVPAAEEVVTQQRAERMAEGREIAKWFMPRVGVDERQDLIDKVKRLRQAAWAVFDGFADALDEAPQDEQPEAA